MTRRYQLAAIFALIMNFIKPSTLKVHTTRPQLSVNNIFMINYITRNICTPKGDDAHWVHEKRPDASQINLELHTSCHVYKASFKDSKLLWKYGAFNSKKNVVIFATGWSNKYLTIGVIESMARPYLCRQDNNFIGINFDSYLESIKTKFTKAHHNEIAGNLSLALEELIKEVPVENIHLIGHSMGAHIVSTASRLLRMKTKAVIPRITALDPSKPCYPNYGMQTQDAKFCEVFHTSPDELGKKEPAGDVDFYFGGLKANQPGCETSSCSSHRAWEYYAESAEIGGNTNFRGSRCRTWDELVAGNCVNNTQVNAGYATNAGTKGIFVVPVNSQYPYGPNSNRYGSNNKQACWKCPKA